MKIKRLLCTLLTALFTLGLCACSAGGGTASSQNASPEGKTRIGFSVIDMENPYFISLQEAVQETLNEAGGYELITEDPGTDSEDQVEQIHEMIQQGIDAIILSPVDEAKIRPALVELQQADVKIVNVDTKVKEIDFVDSYIGSDNYRAGYICGEDLVERCPEGGKVAILEAPSMNSVNDRISGFEDALAEAENPFEIVDREDTMGELELALEETQAILNEQPDLTVIMCGNDQAAVGAKTAANLAGRSTVYIYGVDGSPDIKKELKKAGNQIVGTAAQSPITMGHDAADTVIRILTGQEYEKEILEDVFMINAENVDEYGTDGWQ